LKGSNALSSNDAPKNIDELRKGNVAWKGNDAVKFK